MSAPTRPGGRSRLGSAGSTAGSTTRGPSNDKDARGEPSTGDAGECKSSGNGKGTG